MIELGTTGNATADYCLVYNYSLGAANPSSCQAPSVAAGNNGNVVGYWYEDNVNSSYSHTASYSYDGVNRLSGAVATGSSTYNLSYSYDAYGNMNCVLGKQTSGPCPQLSYNAASNQITSSGYSYDAAGNQTNDPSNLSTHTYQWDGDERVATVDSGSTWSFTYNALGHRAQWASSGSTAQHFFDPEGNWLGLAGSYTMVRFGDRPLALYEGTQTYFNHVNALGSTSIFTNQGGTAIEDMLFYPWGDVWQSWGSGGYIFAKLPYDDVTTNTNLTTARVNSPNFGRWFTPDPAGKGAVRLDDPQTWNMYAYVRNNPTTLTDPSGLYTPDPINGSQGPQIESTYSEPNVVVDDTGGHRPSSAEKKQPSGAGQNGNNGSDITKMPPPPPAPHVEYRQSNGDTSVKIGSLTILPLGNGYAGHNQGLNNPANEGVEENYAHPDKSNAGPLPVGNYSIGPIGTHYVQNGTVELHNSMRLTPSPGTDLLGRSGGFLFHQGSFATMGDSQGCIVERPNVLVTIGNSGIVELEVVH